MPRASKTPRYDAFNAAANTFGTFSNSPKEWQKLLVTGRPLVLELGCGKAELSLGMARKHTNQNHIGIDLKADRLWRASKIASMEQLNNIVFIQSNILDVATYINPSSVDTIWITFPDPFPKKRQAKHRMLNTNFLSIYQSILKDTGIVRFKTDNQALFEWALAVLTSQKNILVKNVLFDLHESMSEDDDAGFVTAFEARFLAEGTTTKYLEFSFL